MADAKGEKKSGGSARKKDKDKRKSERTVYVASAREQAPGGAEGSGARPMQVKTGISDGSYIEVIEGLKEGDRVIVGVAKEASGGKRAFNPFGFARRK